MNNNIKALTDIQDLREIAERVTPLLNAGIGNYPLPRQADKRVVGFKLDADVAGLSDGLLMAEAAREALRNFVALLDENARLRAVGQTLSDTLNAYGYPVSAAHWANVSGSMDVQARALHLAAESFRALLKDISHAE